MLTTIFKCNINFNRKQVNGYEAPGSYRRKINYDVNMEQLAAIIKKSQRCEQFIKYECFNAGLFFDDDFLTDSWWVSRDGATMLYWGGAEPGSGNCSCGMSNTCISQSMTKRCNCDNNKWFWTEDSGYLTDKSTLPVGELRFGDTGLEREVGYHTLGKLQCWG